MWVDFSFLGFAQNKHYLPLAKEAKGKWMYLSGQDTVLQALWSSSCLVIYLGRHLHTLSLPVPAGQLFIGPEQKIITGLSQTINQK